MTGRPEPLTDDEVVIAEMLLARGYGITPVSRLLGRDPKNLQHRMTQLRKDRLRHRMQTARCGVCAYCGTRRKALKNVEIGA